MSSKSEHVCEMEVPMTADFDNNEEVEKINMDGVPEQLVFGLDIGTRSIVGTVGYKESTDGFVVVAQTSLEHETRAMMDGQIHDINMVADSIKKIHKKLEYMTGRSFKDVCIAAAGRVLKTVEAEGVINFQAETTVTSEHIYTLDMLGIENAYEKLRKEKESDDIRFYCVGYSVKHYYQNDYPISNLEGHKCNTIKSELIATFLPDEVVDGLYAAVERAGLFVANLTLEPIAAINLAIPEKFRLLNIALVDVGAGTSDISITKDGSIIAYGMIPSAGDEITECIARHYLTDFNEADRMKCMSTTNDEVEFQDIMCLPQKVSSSEIAEVISDTVRTITKSVAEKIIELNGNKSVSAVFVVGGGGKAAGFVESLSEFLGLTKERVALRGIEVLSNVKFMQKDVTVDSLLVTPIGICLNYYEQRNNFIFATVNGERVKLYDNGRLTITDAAMQAGFPNEDLFPKRGKSIEYCLNGEKRMLRGKEGEAAVIKLNGHETGMSASIEQNAKIEITPSTVGEDAVLEIGGLSGFKSTVSFIFNDKEIICPKFVLVNGGLVSEFYEVQDGDDINILDYYTLKQVLEFMDVLYHGDVYVNNVIASMDTKVYENFTVKCEILDEKPDYGENASGEDTDKENDGTDVLTDSNYEDNDGADEISSINGANDGSDTLSSNGYKENDNEGTLRAVEYSEKNEISTHSTGGETAGDNMFSLTDEPYEQDKGPHDINIILNGSSVTLKGKSEYILVDALDICDVDTSVAHGENLETEVNGIECDFTQPVNEGDIVRIEWV